MSLQSTPIEQVMSTSLRTVHEEKDVNFIEVLMELKQVRHIPVLAEDGTPKGVVSSEDIVEHLSVAGASHFAPARTIMGKAVTVAPDETIGDAARLMKETGVSCLLVTRDNKLVGVLTEKDFVTLLAK